jgi:TolA-binding protein
MVNAKSMKDKQIRLIIVYASLLFSCISIRSAAQKTAVYRDPEAIYKKGVELFFKEKYSAAQLAFEKTIENPALVSGATMENAAYYRAVCAAELFHSDAEALLWAFINSYPESLKLKLAYFQLGRFYYKQKKYKSATDAFEMADVYYLTNDEITEFYFKSGYGYFVKGDMVKAEKSFHNVINVESRYKPAANYYYAHIAYANDNYATALSSFNKLNESEAFGPIVPLYIAQIYFDQAKYDELVKYAIPLLDSPKLQNAAEMKRLIAESYFRLSDYKQSLVYFIDYQKSVPRIPREDIYQKAFCYYQTMDYASAVTDFQKVTDGNDQLSQNAYFHMGDSYLKSSNKQSARNSFQFASKLTFDKKIQEESLFNYAKLSYELSYQPVAISAFVDFQKQFPESPKKDEASLLLADIYTTTHNYKDALASLEKIENKTEKINRAYQKAAYFRGIEFYNNADRQKAIGAFEKAIVNNTNPAISSMAMYWKAEALYAEGQFDAAMKEYRIFLFSPAAVSLEYFNAAHYNIGYCFFKLENYDESQVWFRKYMKNKAETDNDRYNDAAVRVADANFMLREYDIALDFYKEAVNNKAKGADYCLFQKGMIMGIKGNMSEKAASMQTVINNYKKSSYLDDAIYEKGNALLAMGKNSESLVYFEKIVASYPNSSYTRKALINIGLVNYSEKDDEKALATYKQVIAKYPSTPEASEALTGIKNIYVNSGNPNGFFEYAKTVPSASISSGAQDSITYEAAEQRYMKGATDAGKDFSGYLEQFPNGYFNLNATFYKAEIDYKNKNLADALTGYEYVTAQPKNIFTEKSLLKAGYINFKNKSYDKALEHYVRLEEIAEFPENIMSALAGEMRCGEKLKKCDAAVIAAQKIISSEKVPADLLNEAHLVSGRCALAAADYTLSQKEFTLAARSANSESGAESKYNLAYIQYLLNNYKESQKLSFEVINQVPSYDFWIAKSFLLLADNYTALKDNFQAKSTLKSLLENYERNPDDPEDIKAMAGEKLNAITSRETEQQNKELKEDQKLVPAAKDSTDQEPDGN